MIGCRARCHFVADKASERREWKENDEEEEEEEKDQKKKKKKKRGNEMSQSIVV